MPSKKKNQKKPAQQDQQVARAEPTKTADVPIQTVKSSPEGTYSDYNDYSFFGIDEHWPQQSRASIGNVPAPVEEPEEKQECVVLTFPDGRQFQLPLLTGTQGMCSYFVCASIAV